MMKLRISLLLSTCLLLGAALASTTPAGPGAAPAPASAVPASAALAPAAPFCAASLSTQEPLPFRPSPKPRSGFAIPCGSCSQRSCGGLNVRDTCYYLTRTGYAIGTCHDDSVCSDNSDLCICRNGPDL